MTNDEMKCFSGLLSTWCSFGLTTKLPVNESNSFDAEIDVIAKTMPRT
jgi:hypothetical protein